MSKIARRMRRLSERAARISQVVQTAPQRAAQLRESVLAAAGQLSDLQTEVQGRFAGVNIDTEERFLQAVAEVNEHLSVFESAGYELTGADVEILPARRVTWSLDRFETVRLSAIRALAAENDARRTVQALLDAILKAEEISGKLKFSELEYRGIVVKLGAVATVRLCWNLVEEMAVQSQPAVIQAAPPVTVSQVAPLPTFNSGGFFQPRVSSAPEKPSPAPPAASVTPSVPAPQPEAETPETATAAPATDWRLNALDRFKKMPNVSKYKR